MSCEIGDVTESVIRNSSAVYICLTSQGVTIGTAHITRTQQHGQHRQHGYLARRPVTMFHPCYYPLPTGFGLVTCFYDYFQYSIEF